MGHSARRTLGIFLAIICLLALALPAGAAPPGNGGKGKLRKQDREAIAQAKASGERNVTLLIAATPGASKGLARDIAALGGAVRYQDDALGYIRAIVPIDKAEAVAALGSIEAVNADEIIPLDDPRPDGAQGVAPQPPPGAGTPRDNPYMPIGDTGAAQFMAAHPAWDGRGVTVGIMDSGVDLGHPSLQTTSTGERKITDWVTYTDPLTDGDPTWVNMKDQVSGASFTYKGVTYTAPAAGSHRIGLFNERDPNLGGEVGSDVNRDGNPAGSSGIFAVLWNTASNKVWVDTNQNNSFADQAAMTDYKVAYDVGTFGTDNPATPIREAMPFVVQTDPTNGYVNIGIVSGAHGSHVAGIVAAHAMFGGQMSGAAPGAKLKSARVCLFVAGCTAHALIEGMIYLVQVARVDAINMSIGGLPALNDGNNARAELYDRLIRTYNVQMFFSAGNSGSGMNTVGDPSVATLVMSVGSYITNETWQSNYGSDSTFVDNMHGYSSRGPREDGGFKPNIVAPGSAISTVPTWQPGGPVLGTYALPPGYAMFNGTSMASPQAAGAAALLISAARQTNNRHEAALLRQAMNSSARYGGLEGQLGRYGAYEIGNGLIDVGAAWEILRSNVKIIEISSAVPVNTALSGFLKTPGVGVGINDREGVKVGQSYTRTYTFLRGNDNNGHANYNVRWVGNDGTFSSASSIVLRKNEPVTLTVTINPTTAGAHSAILHLDDPKNPGVEYQTMNVVVAADQFTVGNNYSVTKTGSIGRNQTVSYFFNVPAKTPAFKVDLASPIGAGDFSAAGAGQVRFLRFHPYGVGIDSNATTNCYNPSVGGCSTGSPLSRTTSNPQAGVWEVTVEARRTSDAASAPFTLTASILGASVTPDPDVIASAQINVPIARSYTLTNLYGPFTGRAVGTTLGSAKIATPSIANGAQQTNNVTVTAGTTSLRATIGGTSDPAADLDLFVYRGDCAVSCTLVGQAADGDSEESVTLANPTPGIYTVVVDGYAVPAGTTTYKYTDVFVNAAFGSISVTDANALRAAGSSWMVNATITANAAPATGRVLYGNVQVRTDGNVLVGSGDVIINSVTP